MGKKLTTLQFIDKSQLKHGDKYDYSSIKYTNANTKVNIICKKHGIFKQRAAHHLNGHGCNDCTSEITRQRLLKNTRSFIKEANIIHNNKYDYTKTIYKKSIDKVKIVCLTHNVFEQEAASHLQGHGCPTCARNITTNYQKSNAIGWSYTNWQKSGERSKNFDSFKVYIIRCWNENEEFYKIGKTYTTLKKRLGKSNGAIVPYNYKIIKIIKSDSKEISDLEYKLKVKNKKYKYIPLKKFGGMQECFKNIEING